MTVFGYIFLPREKEHLVAPAVQQLAVQKYASSLGLVVDDIVVEEYGLLKRPFKERPEGEKLFRAVQPGDTIIVMKAEWILGSAREASRLVRMLKNKFISLYCVDLETNITLDEKRKLMVYEGGAGVVQKLLAALAICESCEHGDAIRATKKKQKREGKYLGGPVPFGWEVSKKGFLVRNQEQQKVISAIVAMRNDRWSFRDISRKLKEEYELKLSHEGVRRVLNSNQKRKQAEKQTQAADR